MEQLQYCKGHLTYENVDLVGLAETYGTPCYVYSRATLEHCWRAFDESLTACDHLICYAVKANSNLAVLNVLARLGSGFDIVSGGELERVLAAGGDPAKVVFSGVGKTVPEILRALSSGIGCFNVESTSELEVINEVAGEMGKRAPVALRINPDVDSMTHPYITTGIKGSKFGIPIQDASTLYQKAARMEYISVVGIDSHIGSQLTSLEPFVFALDRVLMLIEELSRCGLTVHHLNLGGGLGIRYRDENPPTPAEYTREIMHRLRGRPLKLILEPGRAIVGNAGIMLTRVIHLKQSGEHHFAIVDAAMNDLIRPALYNAWHDIMPVELRAGDERNGVAYDIVGPVCETGDFLGKQRVLALRPLDLLVIRSTGAYGFVMSSNYNSRPRPPELMVDDDRVHQVRSREHIGDLLALECTLPP